MALPRADHHLTVGAGHRAHLFSEVSQLVNQAPVSPFVEHNRIVIAHQRQQGAMLLNFTNISVEGLLPDKFVAARRVLTLVSQEAIVYRDKHHRRFCLAVEQVGRFWLTDSIKIVLRAELAKQSVRVVDFSTDDLTVPVNARHQVLRRVHISRQDAFLVLVKREGRPVLCSRIQVPKLNDLVETASNEPLVAAENGRNLLVMSVKALDHGTRKQRKQIDLIVEASESEGLRSGELRRATNARLSHEVRLGHLQRLVVNLNEAVGAVR